MSVKGVIQGCWTASHSNCPVRTTLTHNRYCISIQYVPWQVGDLIQDPLSLCRCVIQHGDERPFNFYPSAVRQGYDNALQGYSQMTCAG